MKSFYYIDKKKRKGKISAISKSAAQMELTTKGIDVKKFITEVEYKKVPKKSRKLTTVVADVKKRITEYGTRYLAIKSQALNLKNEEKGKFIDGIATLQESTHDKVITILGEIGENIAAQRDMVAGVSQEISESGEEVVDPEKERKEVTSEVKDRFVMKLARKVLGTGNKMETEAIQKELAKREEQRETTKKVNCSSAQDYQRFLSQFEQEANTVVITEADRHDAKDQYINKIKIWWARINGRNVVILQAGNAETKRDLKKFDAKKLKEGELVELKKDDTLLSAQKRAKTGNIMVDINNSVNDWLIDSTPIKTKDIVTFYQLLDVMINAGVPLLKSLEELVHQVKNKHLQRIIINALYAIENGSTFSAALSKYPDIFTRAQQGIIKAGEASGSLGDTLKRMASDMEKSAKMAAKIKGAMIYPIAVISILISVGILVMVLIVPRLTSLFGDVANLPASTRTLVGISNFFINYGIIMAVGIALFVMILRAYIKTDMGRYVWDLCKLYIPIFGNLNKKIAIARFTRSLSALSASGVNLIKALTINADSVGNEVYRREILFTIESVQKGVTIHEDLQDSKLFPPMVVNMIGIGEETAQLGHVSEKIADYFDDEVDNIIKNMSTLMEPIIIVVLGISVGLLVSAIMQPIMQIADKAAG